MRHKREPVLATKKIKEGKPYWEKFIVKNNGKDEQEKCSCGATRGYHCMNCHITVADVKNKKAIKEHDKKCKKALWFSPLVRPSSSKGKNI